jgi:hypothetical protein
VPRRCAHPVALQGTRLLKPLSPEEAAGDGTLLMMTQHHAFWSGPRAEASRPGSVGSPRCSRRERTPLGAVSYTSTLSLPLHLPHANTSRAKVRRSSPTQSSRGVRSFFASAFAAASCGGLASCGLGPDSVRLSCRRHTWVDAGIALALPGGNRRANMSGVRGVSRLGVVLCVVGGVGGCVTAPPMASSSNSVPAAC